MLSYTYIHTYIHACGLVCAIQNTSAHVTSGAILSYLAAPVSDVLARAS